jgi:hypothetical protein
MVRLTGVAEEK